MIERRAFLKLLGVGAAATVAPKIERPTRPPAEDTSRKPETPKPPQTLYYRGGFVGSTSTQYHPVMSGEYVLPLDQIRVIEADEL